MCRQFFEAKALTGSDLSDFERISLACVIDMVVPYISQYLELTESLKLKLPCTQRNYVYGDHILRDTWLTGGSGRTDLQRGMPGQVYKSMTGKMSTRAISNQVGYDNNISAIKPEQADYRFIILAILAPGIAALRAPLCC